jgi:diguanylate cyclase (GGDEF)-like protein/PAS domain S-box-containing protein
MHGIERRKAESLPFGDRLSAGSDGNGASEVHAARESARDYRAMLERIPAVAYLAGFGENGRWDYVSPQIESLLGFTAEEWVGDPEIWFRQIHPDDRSRVLEEEIASKASGSQLPSQYRMFTRDGRTIWIRDIAVLVNDESGKPKYWQGFLLDVTDRKTTEQALEASEARHRQLVDNLPVGIYRTTPEGELLEANRALARILGYPDKDSLLEADVLDFFVDPSDRELWMAKIGAEGTVSDFELQLRRPDGAVIWVRDSARAVRDEDERIICYEGALQDITRQKQAEWEAKQASQQAASWVGRLEQRNKEMELIKEMGDMLQTCPTAEEAYAVMAHWAEQLFDVRAGALCVIASSRNVVEPVAVWGEPAIGEPVFGPEDCWALRTGRLHRVDEKRSRLVCRHLGDYQGGVALCVPMMAHGEALGILHLQWGAGGGERMAEGTNDSAERIAVTVAEHLALALANLRLRESLRTQSIRDPLTGLFNRRYMEESLDREFRRAERRGAPVGVIMLDIDRFTNFNNTFGHQAGDTLLHALGELLRTRVRAEDIACRYGGEEFVLIMPEASLEITAERAERLRQEVRELRVQQQGQSLGAVTVSLGVAVSPQHGPSAESVIRAADLALYRAKNEGRDRVATAPSPSG